MTDAEGIHLYGSALRSVFAVPAANALAAAHNQRLPLLNGGGNVLREAAVGFHGVPVGGAFFPGAGSILPARGTGEAKVHDGHPVGQGAQCRVGGGESADQDGVAHGFSLETSGWVPSPCQG